MAIVLQTPSLRRYRHIGAPLSKRKAASEHVLARRCRQMPRDDVTWFFDNMYAVCVRVCMVCWLGLHCTFVHYTACRRIERGGGGRHTAHI